MNLSTGWLVALTVVWLLLALCAGVYLLALANAPQGGDELGLAKERYDIMMIIVLYVLSAGLAVVAFLSGFGLVVSALYLLPHALWLLFRGLRRLFRG